MRVYFRILRGLRGCYMPDDSRVFWADTFRQFCAILKAEAETHELTSLGQNQFAWEHVKTGGMLDVCTHADKRQGYGLMIGAASESDFFEEAGEIPPNQFGEFFERVREGFEHVTADGALHNVGALVAWVQEMRAEYPALTHRPE